MQALKELEEEIKNIIEAIDEAIDLSDGGFLGGQLSDAWLYSVEVLKREALLIGQETLRRVKIT
ncbi:hypothetical protein CPK_ORF00660 [Chlamydia pneumoniae LPCoLN]|uniref:hypothetical protein n=1 Tax=Chlamydia pneumoniae TaxID=83558 RepID=UPI0001BD9D79|nr:hypothetical protein [Chlamydia pneumoniae]ACZ33129.1 hypothetical protein CPK_ORF00660 [Chlamydia pneumoniae LPCoLN]ETR80031.1 hypothetical protein X556_0643 [Chlamydia pneumoniae B21]